MAPPPPTVAVVVALLALVSPGQVADVRPRRALLYITQHPTGTSTSTRSHGVSSDIYYATGPDLAPALHSVAEAPVEASPPALPINSPSLGFDGYPGFAAANFVPTGLAPGVSNALDPLLNPDSPYGNVPPPPPPPPGPPPPYTVNPARGLTYETAPQAPPLRASYAPSRRITYGRVGVLARVGYTAPPIEVAAPALLFTSAKDGGLAGSQQPPAPYRPFEHYVPNYTPSPYASYSPTGPTGPSFNPRPPPPPPRGGRVFRPSPRDPNIPSAPAPSPFYPALPALPDAILQDPAQPARNPADPAPVRFVQNFVAPPVSPILLSRNRGGEQSFYLGAATNYLR